jgi:hypothetical protein
LHDVKVIFHKFSNLTYVIICLISRVRKIAKSISIDTSVCAHGTTRLPLDGFWLNLIFKLLSRCVEKIQVLLHLTRISATWHETFSHLWQYLDELFLEWKMFSIKVIEKIKTHILCFITFFRKSCRLWDNVEKYCAAREATNNAIRRMRVTCWISKAARAHAQRSM